MKSKVVLLVTVLMLIPVARPASAKKYNEFELKELREELGLSGILAELNCGGLVANDKVMRSLQLMCERVAPRFR